MPCSSVQPVKLLLYEHCSIFFDGILFQRIRGDFDSPLRHFVGHCEGISTSRLELSVRLELSRELDMGSSCAEGR